MKRIIRPESAGVPVQEAEGGEWLEHYPRLVEFLTSTQFNDPPGPRKPGSLSIWTRFRSWCCSLRCPNDHVVLRLEALTPDQLLHAIETILCTGGGPWEMDKAPDDKPPRRRR